MNIILQNKYQRKNQQGSIFLYQARNNKQDSTPGENKTLCIVSDYGGVWSLFCLWIAVWCRLSCAWHTCAPSYCLSYFLFKIYMKNIYTEPKKFDNAGQIVTWCTCSLGLSVHHRLSQVWHTCAPLYWLSYF